MSRIEPTHCYIDESIHQTLGFVSVAFVFAAKDLDPVIASALTAAGLDPAREEFKSGARMLGNASMQTARDQLLEIIREQVELGVVFAPLHRSVPLGKQCLQALQSILVRNGIRPADLTVFVDQGVFRSSAEAKRLIELFRFLKAATFRPYETSHICRGIQLADLVAHTFAQIVREALTGISKMIDLGGPETGYDDGAQISLSELLLNSIRHTILTRRMLYDGDDFEAATDPVLLGPDDDPIEYGQYPEAFGWGIQVAPEANDALREAVRQALDRIWLGCWH